MSIRERRRARRDGEPAAPAPVDPNEDPNAPAFTLDPPLQKKTKEIPMTKGVPALVDRPDDEIDKLLENPNYGPDYQVIYAITRKASGNLYSGIRTGVRGPLVAAKSIGQACAELISGGGVYKIEVAYPTEDGNRKRLFPAWLESFEGPPKVGEPYASLTLSWDGVEGAGDGQWTTVPKPGGSAGQSIGALGASGQGQGNQGAMSALGTIPGWVPPVRDHSGRLQPPPASMGLPAALRSFSPEDQWLAAQDAWHRTYGVKPPLGPTDIAMKWQDSTRADWSDERAKLARTEERLEGMRDRNIAAVDAERRKNAELEKRFADLERNHEKALAEARQNARDVEHRAELNALKQMIEVRATQTPAPSTAAGLAPFVPVLAAAITAWGTAQQAQAQRQADLQMMMLKPPPPPPPAPSVLKELAPIFAAVAPIAGPALLQWLNNQSPAARSELATQLQLAHQGQVQMMIQFIKEMSAGEPEPPWWQEPLMGAFQQLAAGAQHMMIGAGQRMQTPMLPAPEQTKQPIQAEVRTTDAPRKPSSSRQEASVDEAPPPIAGPTTDLETIFAQLSEVDQMAGQQCLMVMRQISALAHRGELDARLVTSEWAHLLFMIHQTRPGLNDIREIASRVADHIEHCRTYSLLPANFSEIFSRPEESVWEFMHRMPINLLDTNRAKAITKAIADEITLRENERKRELGDEPSGETLVSPAAGIEREARPNTSAKNPPAVIHDEEDDEEEDDEEDEDEDEEDETQEGTG